MPEPSDSPIAGRKLQGLKDLDKLLVCGDGSNLQFRSSRDYGTRIGFDSATDSTLGREKKTGKYRPLAQGWKRSR